MKKYITFLITLGMASLMSVGCLSDYDNDGLITYDSDMPCGVYSTEWNRDSVKYTAVVTKNNEGKPMVYVTSKSVKTNATDHTLFNYVSDTAYYVETVGQLNSKANSSFYSSDETKCFLHQSRHDGNYYLQVKLNDGSLMFTSTVQRSQQLCTPKINTTWTNADASHVIEFYNDGSLEYENNGNVEQGNWTYTVGSIDFSVGDKKCTARFNDDYQLELDLVDTTLVVYPEVTQETFTQSLGIYQYYLDLFGQTLKGQLFRGDLGTFKLAPFVSNSEGLTFKVSDNNVISFKDTFIWEDPEEGGFGKLFIRPTSTPSIYKNGRYVLSVEIYCAKGNFGATTIVVEPVSGTASVSVSELLPTTLELKKK